MSHCVYFRLYFVLINNETRKKTEIVGVVSEILRYKQITASLIKKAENWKHFITVTLWNFFVIRMFCVVFVLDPNVNSVQAMTLDKNLMHRCSKDCEKNISRNESNPSQPRCKLSAPSCIFTFRWALNSERGAFVISLELIRKNWHRKAVNRTKVEPDNNEEVITRKFKNRFRIIQWVRWINTFTVTGKISSQKCFVEIWSS